MYKRHDWKSAKFRNTRNDGITGEITIKENGRKVDFLIFNDNNGYKRIISIMKKYGFYPPKINDEEDYLNSMK